MWEKRLYESIGLALHAASDVFWESPLWSTDSGETWDNMKLYAQTISHEVAQAPPVARKFEELNLDETHHDELREAVTSFEAFAVDFKLKTAIWKKYRAEHDTAWHFAAGSCFADLSQNLRAGLLAVSLHESIVLLSEFFDHSDIETLVQCRKKLLKQRRFGYETYKCIRHSARTAKRFIRNLIGVLESPYGSLESRFLRLSEAAIDTDELDEMRQRLEDDLEALPFRK